MINQNLFIFEFVSGGGYNQCDMPSSLFCEGYAMLRVIVEDFKKLGFKISILLDKRISHLSRYLNSDLIQFVKPKEDFLKKYIDKPINVIQNVIPPPMMLVLLFFKKPIAELIFVLIVSNKLC